MVSIYPSIWKCACHGVHVAVDLEIYIPWCPCSNQFGNVNAVVSIKPLVWKGQRHGVHVAVDLEV